MLLIAVGNVASFFRQIYMAQVTPIQFFLICCIQCHLHLYSFFWPMCTSLWLFSFATVTGPMYSVCLPFSWWKSSNQSHCNLKSSFGLFWTGLTIQNVGTQYAVVHKIPEDVLPCFDKEVANILFNVHLIMMIYTIHVYVVKVNVLWLIYLDPIMTQPPVCVNNISWVWIWTDKPYNSTVLSYSGHQVWDAILAWFISTSDHSMRFVNTIWKIFLIYLYWPTVVNFTSQEVLP